MPGILAIESAEQVRPSFPEYPFVRKGREMPKDAGLRSYQLVDSGRYLGPDYDVSFVHHAFPQALVIGRKFFAKDVRFIGTTRPFAGEIPPAVNCVLLGACNGSTLVVKGVSPSPVLLCSESVHGNV
ncbi:hypothetical protein ACN47E_000849 [Coniothyrium glycines]